jgi:uncharacterized protein YndB with AHSA1/START domain
MKNDQVRVSVQVRVPPEAAFDVFTKEVELWWRTGPKFRNAGKRSGKIQFECALGGRLFETWEGASGAQLFEVGKITAWEPPRRFVFEWRASNFEPHELTEVEVTFEALGAGTMVTVVHRGFSKLRADHPVRHGDADAAFLRRMAMWWGDQATSLRELVVHRTG